MPVFLNKCLIPQTFYALIFSHTWPYIVKYPWVMPIKPENRGVRCHMKHALFFLKSCMWKAISNHRADIHWAVILYWNCLKLTRNANNKKETYSKLDKHFRIFIELFEETVEFVKVSALETKCWMNTFIHSMTNKGIGLCF